MLLIGQTVGYIENIYAYLDDWLETRLLQWLEVLALLHELGRAVGALNGAKEWLTLVSIRNTF